ncbi:hypothetical protein CF394_02800 [Tetzosporium hominis]|uniref:Calcineurin-like phosphoesterase domain-containing protein n=1 Tax=Tetzosporium hominis TaxID=2020506 RepID=A0A264W707_9BACL|nr:metallophosphoesterase [Tetzosporium hominis]OZS79366.1 hypothetical protein CF394_02800 [Tetzosporium hominis]
MLPLALKSAVYALRYMTWLAHENNVITHQMKTSKFSGQAKVLFISDIHSRRLSNSLLKRLPNDIDAVLIGGDLTEGGVPIEQTTRTIKLLSSLAPCYYVFGNNDREVGEERLTSMLESNHVNILTNKSLLHPSIPMQIVGIDDAYTGTVDMNKAFEAVQSDLFTIFMSHSPLYFSKLDSHPQVDLAVAGHHHGGQIRFLKWGLRDLGDFKRKGLRYELISNGYGTTALPFRLGAESEVHVIEIQGKK